MTLYVILLIIYVVALIAIGIVDYFKTKDFDSYVVAGRKQSTFMVTASLLATTIGGTATLGVIGMVYAKGFPSGFWYLAVGGIGLILQSIFIAKKVRKLKAYTLADVAQKTIGKEARVLMAIIIMIAWVGIIAAQFLAAGQLVGALLDSNNLNLIMIIVGVVMISYAALGGQFSILKTDMLQFVLLSSGIIVTVITLFFFKSAPGFNPLVQLFNPKFGAFSLIYYLFIFGGSYFIGPDMFSRVFTAKDGNTAKRATLISGIVLIVVGALIALIGVWAQAHLPNIGKGQMLGQLKNNLPVAGAVLFIFGLLSAVISSADTVLLTTASIFENDIIGKKNTLITRLIVVVMGIASLLLAIFDPSKSIIGLFFKALAIYTPAVVFPLMVSIFVYKKKTVNNRIMLTGIVIGGSLGLISNLSKIQWLALLGMGLSLLFAILSVYIGKRRKRQTVS